MTLRPGSTSPASFSRRSLLAGSATAATLALLGCGGGGSDAIAGVSTGGTGSFSSGPIHGFGSIIVGGVRYDDSAAAVTTESGAGSSADLRLGMVVDVSGGEISTDSATGQRRATAQAISVRSEIEGPISAIDTVAGAITVLGQRVTITAATVFDDDLRGGIAGLTVGRVVEIYGLLTGTGEYVATRIDDEDGARRYKLRGPVSGLDTVARTFRIGSALVSYAGLTAPAALANGGYARVELATTPGAAGVWTATSLQVAATAVNLPATGRVKAEVEGYITDFTSSTRFAVNGVRVDASGVTRLPDGMALGQRVEVEGVLEGGVLVAREVEIDKDSDGDDGFEIEGRITSVNAAAQTFVVRGVTVRYDARTRFEDGTAAQLAVGVEVEVTGQLSSDGATLLASKIEFDD